MDWKDIKWMGRMDQDGEQSDDKSLFYQFPGILIILLS